MRRVNFRVNFLGNLQILIDEKPAATAIPHKTQLLLAYLSLRKHAVSREDLYSGIWPESETDEQAKDNLKRALGKIRKWFPASLEIDPAIRFIPPPDFELDVIELEHLLSVGSEEALLKATALYQGHFLAGLSLHLDASFGAWLDHQRDNYRNKIYGALSSLVVYYARRPDLEKALGLLENWLNLDPLHAEANQLKMALYALFRKAEFAGLLRRYQQYFPEDRRVNATLPDRPDAALALFNEMSVPYLDPNGGAPFMAPALFNYPLSGRQAILEKTARDLSAPTARSVFILMGMGGIGKTTLAVNLAHVVRSQFKGGVFWGSLSDGSSLNDIILMWAKLMGHDLSGISNPAHLMQEFRRICQNRKSLFILDDVDDTAMLDQLIPAQFAGKYLITQRDRIGTPNADSIEVSLLLPDDCLDLLASVIGQDRVDAERDAALTLAGVVECLPIALMIIAHILRITPDLGLGELADDLEANFANLDLFDKVRQIFERSWIKLTAEQQALFNWVALFGTRAFTAEVMAELLNPLPMPVQSGKPVMAKEAKDASRRVTQTNVALNQLSAKYLLQALGHRTFRLHAMIADFALTKLAQSGQRSALTRRYLDYYLALAQKKADHPERFSADWGNLHAAIELAYQIKDWESCLRLIKSLTKIWAITGEYSTARTYLPKGIDAATRLGRTRDQAELLVQIGLAAIEQNANEEATGYLDQGGALYDQLYRDIEIDGHSPDDDLKGKATVLRLLGRSAIVQFHKTDDEDAAALLLKKAESYFSLGYDIYGKLNDVEGLADTLFLASDFDFIRKGDDDLQRVHDRVGHVRTMLAGSALTESQKGLILINLLELRATAALMGRDHVACCSFCQEAIALCERWGEQPHRANLHYVHAQALYHLRANRDGELAQGLEQIDRAIQALARMGDNLTLARCYQTKMALHKENGQPDSCATAKQKAVELYDLLGYKALVTSLNAYGC